jgi:polysaccharide export outer membrane protein
MPARTQPVVTYPIIGAVIACLAGIPAHGQESAGGGYAIKPGDILEISVWNEEQMRREVLVRPDGGISYPLAGDLQAGGRTASQLEAEIGARLQKYIPDAVITVAAREIRGNSIYVLGKVNRPGPYVMNGDTDVMQALSMAGGTATFAGLNKIVILRRGAGGESRAIPFRYGDVESGENLEMNIVLQAGDVVVVP